MPHYFADQSFLISCVLLFACFISCIFFGCCFIVVFLVLFLKCSAVDNKHATIEYDDAIGCFVLQDLGTVFGTYINGCQIRNSMVHLRDGDVIKIGFGPTAVQYEFNSDSGCVSSLVCHCLI